VSSRRFFLPAKSQSDFREDFDRHGVLQRVGKYARTVAAEISCGHTTGSASARRFVEIVVVKAAKKQDVSPPVRVT